jgi:polysaccharide biosynthesis protein PslH
MRILFVSPRQCWPSITGARLREYYLARALGKRAELTHVFFADPGDPPEPGKLPDCVKRAPVPLPPRYTLGKILRAAFGRWPLPVLNYHSPEMEAALSAVLREQRFDLVHLECPHMAPCIPLLEAHGGVPFVVDWHNIESEAMRRYAREADSLPRKAYASLTARKLARLEAELLRTAAGHLVCSQRERARLLEIAPKARIAVIENGVDARSFQAPEGAEQAPRTRVVFVGSMNYYPNIEAALYFTRDTWPELHRRFPSWRLTLVGSRPAPAVLALRGAPGVEVTGAVEDVRPYYQTAVAAVVPLRTGGGTRLKILEALAAGVPVVSTRLGAEGLATVPDVHYLPAETPAEWLAQFEKLAPQDACWRQLAQAGKELAASHYDWDIILEPLLQIYGAWLDESRK